MGNKKDSISGPSVGWHRGDKPVLHAFDMPERGAVGFIVGEERGDKLIRYELIINEIEVNRDAAYSDSTFHLRREHLEMLVRELTRLGYIKGDTEARGELRGVSAHLKDLRKLLDLGEK